MTKYRLHFNAGASASVTVEAEDFEAAIEAAYPKVLGLQVCARCAGWGSSRPGIDLGEFEFDESCTAENSVVER